MNDEEVISALQNAPPGTSAVDLAELVAASIGVEVGQFSLVTYFKRAFPAIPLRLLLDAGAWHRVSDGGMSDDEFNDLLRPWLDQERS